MSFNEDDYLKKPLILRIPQPERHQVVELLGEVYQAGQRDMYRKILDNLPEEDFELLLEKLEAADRQREGDTNGKDE